MKDYYAECIREAFEDAKIVATQEQIDIVISWVEGAAENRYMATGEDVADRNFREAEKSEIQKLKDELWKEKQKRVCKECSGHGWITTSGPYHSSTSECHKCRGAGRL